jgi:hypothetical protein
MQVQVAIGANHHFELREALLVYRDNNSSFITRHKATVRKDVPRSLLLSHSLSPWCGLSVAVSLPRCCRRTSSPMGIE